MAEHVGGCNAMCDGDSHYLPPSWQRGGEGVMTGEERDVTGPVCADCGHVHTVTGCAGPPTLSDRWAGVSPAACDCDTPPAVTAPDEGGDS